MRVSGTRISHAKDARVQDWTRRAPNVHGLERGAHASHSYSNNELHPPTAMDILGSAHSSCVHKSRRRPHPKRMHLSAGKMHASGACKHGRAHLVSTNQGSAHACVHPLLSTSSIGGSFIL